MDYIGLLFNANASKCYQAEGQNSLDNNKPEHINLNISSNIWVYVRDLYRKYTLPSRLSALTV